jgi:tungstate transport system substrate-binding protein
MRWIAERTAGRALERGLLSRLALIGAAVVVLLVGAISCGDDRDLILATTTSTQDSGLLDVLVPQFEDEYGWDVKTIAVGSGAALRMGEEGEADVLLSHSPSAEMEFMDGGYGESREPVMYNDFVIVGPPDDPAGIASAATAPEAFALIAESEETFLSRGDESGTNAKELTIWQSASIEPSGTWYQETGQGMGATLTVTNEKRGYTLSDRGTFLAQRENFDLEILFEGDEALFNQYHVIVVSPDVHSEINVEGARQFAEFIRSDGVQATIGSFGAEEFGRALFVPNAND